MNGTITVLDGGMGRELARIGAPFRQPEWSALALTDGPDWVVQAHRNFIDAGAQVITTNSYAIVPFHIGEERFASEVVDLATAAGRLARLAADGAAQQVSVAGSLPPLFGSYRPDLFDAADAHRVIDPLIAGMAGFVDVWLGETLGSIDEAREVRAALDRSRTQPLPLWISYTLADQPLVELRSGESVSDAVRAALDLGASAVLFNCCQAESITAALKITAGLVSPDVQFGGYANRFVTAHTESGEANAQLSSMRDDLSPAEYRQLVHTWLEMGATLVGGCCGMGPDHIAELATLAAERQTSA
jgi:S-methylmethionine-dependent homocysteine/selenocysteine methylase